MKKTGAVIVGLFLLVSCGTWADAAQSEDAVAKEVLNNTYADVRMAQELVAEANRVLQGSPKRSQFEFAINLYARAGQLFEKASGAFKALGTDYAGADDAEGARQAMENCMKSIEQLKQRLREA